MKIAIDPGVTGAIVWKDRDQEVVAVKMPDTPKDILELLQDITREAVDSFCWCERVGGYRPGNSGPSSVKFATHVGHLQMALLAAEISHAYVTPSKWMTKVLGTVPKEKKLRKAAIKQRMQQLYPKVAVTLVNADALGILTYAEM